MSRRAGKGAVVRRVTLALAIALAMGVAAPLTARADDADAEADMLISRGIELRERGKDDEALSVFRQALARAPTPRARAQVALAEQALGMWAAAEADLLTALAAQDDAWIAKNRAALERALAIIRRHLGSLDVRGPDGAEVVLDGVRLGVLPQVAPFRAEAGWRTLELRAKGFYPTRRTVEIPAGGVARETVSLVPAPTEDTRATAAPVTAQDRGVAADDPGRAQRRVGWVLVGTGGAGLLAGGVGLVVRKGVVDAYNASCPGLGAPNQPAECADKLDAERGWLTFSIVSFIAGGVLTIGGFTLVATAPRARNVLSSGQKTAPGCAPSLGSKEFALACGATF